LNCSFPQVVLRSTSWQPPDVCTPLLVLPVLLLQVVNTYQLIAKFLSFKGADTSGNTIQTVEHCDRFWYWLKDVGIVSHRSGVVNAIAEKCNTWIPGIYDSDQYEA
jgi:hypothetical protein